MADGDFDAVRPVRRHSAADTTSSVFINGALTDDVTALKTADAAGGDGGEASINMFPGVGLGLGDSDDDSTESGFSEQDGPALDS